MPTSSTARTAVPPAQSNPATPSAIDLSMFEISVSQLLGFDYVFLGGPAATACFSQLSTAQGVITQLINTLAVAPEQTVFITLAGQDGELPRFTRHDVTWNQGQIEALNHTLIEHPEQQEFINMIWQCSSGQTT
ncbi:hypothetical protein ACSV5M_13540 [Cellvibrio sp. ARAG 10.3]|uniref:hypothetical protein n=1 Tax=Cellvibrio sp. ARAG 10.3 TaxID=3451358 RepID=UPI003F464090